MATEVVLVTPGMAREWLGCNSPNNRKPRQELVDSYARLMRSGSWEVHKHSSVIYRRKSGRMTNGQHRMMAIVKADTAATLVIRYAD